MAENYRGWGQQGHPERYDQSRDEYQRREEDQHRFQGMENRYNTPGYVRGQHWIPTEHRSKTPYGSPPVATGYGPGQGYGSVWNAHGHHSPGYRGTGQAGSHGQQYGRGQFNSFWYEDEEAERRREFDRRLNEIDGSRRFIDEDRREDYGSTQWPISYRGKGPKAYKRSDDRIKEDVSDRLTDDYRLDASNIEVNVLNAEVTLSGLVDSRESKRRAEDITEMVSGVKHVQNNLRITKEAVIADRSIYTAMPPSTEGGV